MTNMLLLRIFEHKQELVEGFSKQYHLHKLLYFEFAEQPGQAIIREKQIKNLSREEKIKLIASTNPKFLDLYAEVLKVFGVQADEVEQMYRAVHRGN